MRDAGRTDYGRAVAVWTCQESLYLTINDGVPERRVYLAERRLGVETGCFQVQGREYANFVPGTEARGRRLNSRTSQ